MEREGTEDSRLQTGRELCSYIYGLYSGALIVTLWLNVYSGCEIRKIGNALDSTINNLDHSQRETDFFKYDANNDGFLDRAEFRNSTSR